MGNLDYYSCNKMKYTINDRLRDCKQLSKKYLKPAYSCVEYELIENSDTVIVTGVTSNSVELHHPARTTRGISCRNWYSVTPGTCLRDFQMRFKEL